MSRQNALISVAACAGALSLSSQAFAVGAVTTGATEVGPASAEKAAVRDGEITDATELALQGGGLLAGGNARSFAVTGGARFLLRRGPSEGVATVAGNYARSATVPGGPVDSTVENLQGKLRYDYFFTQNFSGFFALYGRHDRFQGLDFRLGVDPGVAFYWVRSDEMSLWGEAGYDLQVDDRSTEAILAAEAVDPASAPIEDPTVTHNARLYLGYRQKIEDRLKFEAGIEFFKDVATTDGFRLNTAAQLNTQLVDRFSLALGVMSFYDNTPLAGVKNLDVTTSLSFVYTLL